MPLLTRMFSAGLLLTLAATHVAAASVDEIFRSEDTDGDGALSVVEAQAAAPKTFRAMDSNGDGVLTVEEIAAYTAAESAPEMVWPAEVLASVSQKTLEYWDGNLDGKVTEQEYVKASVDMMLLADSDGDRKVTREELQRFRGEAVTP
ncbi:EF-hand domain-containing protein [Pseudomonas sp. TUM22785]|uniref:EF-hand domain-containing protein n=1 Tax=Pseudomonas sp. TUM22785 TaxID=3019098 RepID=UPI002306A9DC|nr:EF-hand domain-containing protein [Pseudomonas sp. TUM22785]WCD77971.1 EF-hand domain-containing protein [Pseudomonas sp. TUM22785]